MASGEAIQWGIDTELLVELDPPGGGRFRVEGLAGYGRADARIVRVGTPALAPAIRLRPLVDPPGPFDADGLLRITPFVERHEDRAALRAFEARISPRYYAFLMGARHRYAASCTLEAEGIEAPGTAAEVYRIDAPSVEEALALDAALPAPADILAIYEECRAFITPGTHREVWLIPDA